MRSKGKLLTPKRKEQRSGFRESQLTRAENQERKPPWGGKQDLKLMNCWRQCANSEIKNFRQDDLEEMDKFPETYNLIRLNCE